MKCTSPLKGFILGKKSNGKLDLKICSGSIDYVWKRGDVVEPCFFGNYSNKDNFRNSFFYSKNYSFIFDEFIEIPCGKCLSCRLNRANDWAVRCCLEMLYHDKSCFVTLTYDDDNLPPCRTSSVNVVTGELGCSVSPVHSLVKKDYQLFFKRLRKRLGENVRISYYGCGEYGSKNFRPHFHFIIFGFFPDDCFVYRKTYNGDTLFISPFLNDVWGKGYVVVGEANYQSAAYVARYITKKQLGYSSSNYSIFDYEPEFNCMSLKPAIGKSYFDEFGQDLFDVKYLYIKQGIDSSIKTRPP
ncbi:replication initiator protein [Capybara microvirus Cap3_SP_632]|nr:replication initiator protein [Capybara microvirus Cap3_SP_632]